MAKAEARDKLYNKLNGFESNADPTDYVETHHLLEKQYAKYFNIADKDDIISVPLTQQNHRNVGGGGYNIDNMIVNKVKELGGESAENIWQAHKAVYNEMGHSEWAAAIYEKYVKPMGIDF